MKKQNWFLYIIECQDESYYTGITTNIDKRMKAHQGGKGSKYVYAKGFKKLLYTISCKNKSQASKFEYQIKQLPRKEKLGWFEND
jgi:putative endonuclease